MEYDLSAILGRIEERMDELGLKASAVGRMAGRPDCVRNIQRAVRDGLKRKVQLDTLIAIAKVIKSNPEWLITGAGEKEADDAAHTAIGPVEVGSARVIGMTQAGAWFEFEEFENDQAFAGQEVPLVPGAWAGLEQFSYYVRGASMDAKGIVDGSYVICVKYFDARGDLREGDIVVVERKRNSSVERTVKQIEIAGQEVRFCPRSSDQRFKPISVKIDRSEDRDLDDEEVSVVGLVVGTWRPLA